MANNFKVWVDSGSSAAIMNSTTFAEDSQRTNGFSSGSIISSQHVNSALRQSNLVIAALMDIINDSNLSLTSSVADVKTAWVNYFKLTPDATVNDDVVKFTINGQTYNKTIDNVSNASNATNVNITTETSNNNVVKFKVGNGTGYNKTINDVANVTTTINGKNISDIFESNGTTVKNATNAVLNNDNTYSGFTRDTNGILKIGNIIIPQKKIILNGNYVVNPGTSSNDIYFSENLNIGDTLELTLSIYLSGTPNSLMKTQKVTIVYDPSLMTFEQYYVMQMSVRIGIETNDTFTLTIYDNRMSIFLNSNVGSGRQGALYKVVKVIE